MSPHFIGIGHKKQQGKDTLANMLAESLGLMAPGTTAICSFAEPLKTLAMDTLGLTEPQCYGSDEDKNSLTSVRAHDLGLGDDPQFRAPGGGTRLLTAREVLQQLGVSMRHTVPGIWSKAPFRRRWPDHIKVVIIPDVRFVDEAELVRHHGELLKIVRPGHQFSDSHSSETALNDWKEWDGLIVNDGNLVELQRLADRLAVGLMRDGALNPANRATVLGPHQTRVVHAYAGPGYDQYKPFGDPDLVAYANDPGSEEQINVV